MKKPTNVSIVTLVFALALSLACGFGGADEAAETEIKVEETIAAAVAQTRAAEEAAGAEAPAPSAPEDAATEEPARAPAVKPAPTALPASAWEGVYTFTETDENGRALVYVVDVYRAGQELQADIDIDGFQTMNRLRAYGEADGNELDLYLAGYRRGNQGEPYELDAWLLNFEQTGEQLLTYWGNITPRFGDVPDGIVSFTREGETAQATTGDSVAGASQPAGDSRSGYLELEAWLDVDGNDVADFWSDSGGVATRSPTGRGFEDYDSVTPATCQDRDFYEDIPHDPNSRATHCFKTDQGYLGKFRVVSMDAEGGLNLQYTLWDPPAGGSSGGDGGAVAPFTAAIGSPSYERWGRPTSADGCNGPYDDTQPMQRFTVDLFLTNQSGQGIPADWPLRFVTAKNRPVPTCVWENSAVPPGQTVRNRFSTHLPSDDWVSAMIIEALGSQVTVCLNRAGAEVACR